MLIPKSSRPLSFSDYRSISLCNITYKLISKIFVSKIKDTLSEHISLEQFGFLTNHQIHDVVATMQECIHSIHSKKMEALVMKLDMHKAYDCVD